MLYLASYRRPPSRPDPGHVLDWLARWAFHILVCVGTLSRYSHSELVFGPPDDEGYSLCASSSGRDGGVRFAHIQLDPARWTVDPLRGLHPNAEAAALLWFEKNQGAKYDHFGLAAVWLFAVAPWLRAVWRLIQDDRKLFCSEACAEALGLWKPWTRSPGSLRQWVIRQVPR